VTSPSSVPAARREGLVFPEVEEALYWDVLIRRLRGLPRYRAYVDQDIRPLWRAVAESNEMCAAMPSRALSWISKHKDPGSPGWLYSRKLATDPAREFGIAATSGGTPEPLIIAIHQDAAAREIAAAQRTSRGMSTAPEETDLWDRTGTPAGSAIAAALGEDFGLSMVVKPTRIGCLVLGLVNPEYGEPDEGEEIVIDVALNEGVAFDDDYWTQLERSAIEVLRAGLLRMREMIEFADPPRRRPTSIRNALADSNLLFNWLVLKQRPNSRADRSRLRRLAQRLGLLTPGERPRVEPRTNEACDQA
jgi:hypothetical protein